MLKKVVDQKNKRILQKPNGFKGNQTEAKKPDNDNENDNENDNDNEEELLLRGKEEEKLQQRFIECLNSFNTNAINKCISYLDELPFEVIESVLKKTSGIAFPNWNYAQKILDDYVKRNINSMEKVDSENFKSRDQPKGDINKVEDF